MARDDIMRKVQAMLDKAASTTFDAERDSLLAKADELMMRHSIEEVELAAKERGKSFGGTQPEMRDVVVSEANDFDVAFSLRVLFERLTRHVGCRMGPMRYRADGGGWTYKIVGYPADIDYLQMLFLNLQIHFLSKMEPKPDAALTDLENFTNLWEAGMSYERIFNVMGWPWGQDSQTGRLIPETRKILRPMRSAYQAACKAEGREPIKGMKGVTYAKSFIDGYVMRINARLDEMKRAREDAAQGHEIVLASRASIMDEFYWEMFPDTRPHPEDCECEECHFQRCVDDKCTRTKCREWRKQRNKPVRYRAPKQIKVDARARERGRQIANSADLSGNDGRIGGSKKGEL